MKLISSFARSIARFSQQPKPVRSLKSYFKSKKIEEQVSIAEITEEEKQHFQNAHRIMYVPFMPIVLLSLPCMYFFSTPIDPHYLQSCNLLQYYASGMLCFNAYFTQEKMKVYFPFLLGVGAINALTGPLSAISPLLLGGLSFMFPLMNEKEHKTETLQQEERAKAYLGIQALYYFVIVVIATLKSYHYWSREQMEKKLKGYEAQNTAYFSEIQNQKQEKQ